MKQNRRIKHNSEFKPAWWLKGPHRQTIWATMLHRKRRLHSVTERVELDDGDFLDIEWVGQERKDQPIVLIMHGIGGSIESHYGARLLSAIDEQGWRGAFMHFRGCSGSPNRLDRWYSAGDTHDLDYVVKVLSDRESVPIAVVGVSFGGSVLLKWLGEQAHRAPVATGIAVSVPFKLDRVADRVQSGFSRFYQWYFLRHIHAAVRNKFATKPCPIDLQRLSSWNTFWDFDDAFTAPLHGYSSAQEYYQACSCFKDLVNVEKPTLIIQAEDDPLLTEDAVPQEQDLSASISLELYKHGGHVGFISGRVPGKAHYWYENRIVNHLTEYF